MFRKKHTPIRFEWKMALLRAVSGAAFVATTAACGFDLPDSNGGGGGGSGGEFCVGECNGVYVACRNPGDIPHPNPVGADSGSSDGGDGDPPENWYWDQCTSTLPNTSGCGPDDEHCCSPDFSMCYCKTYDNSDGPTPQSIGNVCVGNGQPPGLDPIADWNSGGFPGFESQIHPLCEAKCKELSGTLIGFPLPGCQSATWGDPVTPAAWNPSSAWNCTVAEGLNKDDPFGVTVPWSAAGGDSSPLPLSCDLTGSCSDLFVPSARPYLVSSAEAIAIDPETRGAHYLAGADPTGNPEFFITVDYDGTRHDQGNPVYGLAEFSHNDCGDAVCPFYLANLSASNHTDDWTVPVKLGNGNVEMRTFTDLQISLLQSSLGVENVSLGKVAFAPGSLRLGVEFLVEGKGYGSGTHSLLVENDEFVFADIARGGLELIYKFDLQSLGTATLRLPLAADEEPPEAKHDLIATTGSCSFQLVSGSMQSTDPDNDIKEEYWLVDGTACGETCDLGPGTHEVKLVAVDSRGAVDVSDGHTIAVSGC